MLSKPVAPLLIFLIKELLEKGKEERKKRHKRKNTTSLLY